MNALQTNPGIDLSKRGEDWLVDSRQIADCLGIEHKNLLEGIGKYKNDIENAFGSIAFETRLQERGGHPERFALLTEDQALFVGTLSRNTDKVIDFKTKLVQAFQNARRQAQELSKVMFPSDPHDQVLMLCERLTAMTIEAKQLTQQLVEAQPKIDAWQKFLDSDKLIDLAHVAQVCKTGRNLLYEKMRDEKIFFYKGQYNSVYQQYIDQGYFEIKFKPHPKLGPIPVIKATTKGAEWIYNKFYRKQAS